MRLRYKGEETCTQGVCESGGLVHHPAFPTPNPHRWLSALCLVQKAGKICMLTGAKVKEEGGWLHGPEGSRCFTMIILFHFT